MPHGLNHTPDDPRFIMIEKEFIKQDMEQEISASKKLTVQEKRDKLQELQEKIRLENPPVLIRPNLNYLTAPGLED